MWWHHKAESAGDVTTHETTPQFTLELPKQTYKTSFVVK